MSTVIQVLPTFNTHARALEEAAPLLWPDWIVAISEIRRIDVEAVILPLCGECPSDNRECAHMHLNQPLAPIVLVRFVHGSGVHRSAVQSVVPLCVVPHSNVSDDTARRILESLKHPSTKTLVRLRGQRPWH